MIEKRRPKLRRRGEINGPIDWKIVRSKTVNFLITLACGGAIFFTGMYFNDFIKLKKEATAKYAEICKEYKAFRITGH